MRNITNYQGEENIIIFGTNTGRLQKFICNNYSTLEQINEYDDVRDLEYIENILEMDDIRDHNIFYVLSRLVLAFQNLNEENIDCNCLLSYLIIELSTIIAEKFDV